MRGAALGSDEPPKVKHGLGVLLSFWALSFGVRGTGRPGGVSGYPRAWYRSVS